MKKNSGHYAVALAFLKDGKKRVRSLITSEILYETYDLETAKAVAEAEAQKLGSTGYTWISETIDQILAKKIEKLH
jgi:hypothetical protein